MRQNPDSLSWEAAQAIVKARILQPSSDLRLSFAAGVRPKPVSDEARA